MLLAYRCRLACWESRGAFRNWWVLQACGIAGGGSAALACLLWAPLTGARAHACTPIHNVDIHLCSPGVCQHCRLAGPGSVPWLSGGRINLHHCCQHVLPHGLAFA